MGVRVCGRMGACVRVSHIQALPEPKAAEARGNPGRNRMFCSNLLVGLAAALLRSTQHLKMDCYNEQQSVLEGQTDEHVRRGGGERAEGACQIGPGLPSLL